MNMHSTPLAQPYPSPGPQEQPVPPQGDATGGIIPYKNVPALLAYYLGVFSLIPLFPIGFAALILGILGLKRRRQHAQVKGSVHAWIGILAGGTFSVIWIVLLVALVFLS